jgi:hypothetical protein
MSRRCLQASMAGRGTRPSEMRQARPPLPRWASWQRHRFPSGERVGVRRSHLLRQVRDFPSPELSPPRVVGVCRHPWRGEGPDLRKRRQAWPPLPRSASWQHHRFLSGERVGVRGRRLAQTGPGLPLSIHGVRQAGAAPKLRHGLERTSDRGLKARQRHRRDL